MASTDPLSMTADQILAISDPRVLFGTDAAELRRKLIARWHPDRCSDPLSSRVTAHITGLSKGVSGNGTTNSSVGVVSLETQGGGRITLKFLRAHEIDLGRMYVGRGMVAFVLDPTYAGLAKRASDAIEGVTFPSLVIDDQYRPLIPGIVRSCLLADGRGLLALRKPVDMLLLSDVQASLGGTIDPRHVAWIMSRLYGLGCLMSSNGLCLGATAPDTLLISPTSHAVMPIGWFFSTKLGEPLPGLPNRTLAALRRARVDMSEKRALLEIDPLMIRTTGRDLLGTSSLQKMMGDKNVPTAFAAWLCDTNVSTSAFDEYTRWDDVLDLAWGRRTFVELMADEATVYGTTT